MRETVVIRARDVATHVLGAENRGLRAKFSTIGGAPPRTVPLLCFRSVDAHSFGTSASRRERRCAPRHASSTSVARRRGRGRGRRRRRLRSRLRGSLRARRLENLLARHLPRLHVVHVRGRRRRARGESAREKQRDQPGGGDDGATRRLSGRAPRAALARWRGRRFAAGAGRADVAGGAGKSAARDGECSQRWASRRGAVASRDGERARRGGVRVRRGASAVSQRKPRCASHGADDTPLP